MFNELQPFYAREFQRGNLEIVGYALFENGKVNLVDVTGKPKEGIQSELAIISSRNDFYQRMKFLVSQGVSRNRIIDGRVFQVPDLNFSRFLEEGVAYGMFEDNNAFSDGTNLGYPRVYRFKNVDVTLILGRKSRINGTFPARVEAAGKDNLIKFGNFSAISWNASFELGLNSSHNYLTVNSYGLGNFDWKVPDEFHSADGNCKILIGNEVWIGRGCTLKCTNPAKPLVIGDGAVVASDSVVVKSVPPYAIVGGNPAQIIKYRFPPHVIEALLRIKWWDWSLDKIHDNFKYFNDIEKFIFLHDKEG